MSALFIVLVPQLAPSSILIRLDFNSIVALVISVMPGDTLSEKVAFSSSSSVSSRCLGRR